MAVLVMVYGQSGTGKSTSLRNFKNEEVAVVNVSGKPLPFRGDIKPYNSDNYQKIIAAIQGTDRKSIVIDDATYLMVNAFMRNAKVVGYQKYTDMAYDFNALVEFCANLPEDKIVYFLGHSDQADDGREHFKTIGKMLDEKLTIEGCFDIVLYCQDHKFYTQANNQSTAKSPEDMFELEIPNDLKAVDVTIRKYYGMK